MAPLDPLRSIETFKKKRCYRSQRLSFTNSVKWAAGRSLIPPRQQGDKYRRETSEVDPKCLLIRADGEVKCYYSFSRANGGGVHHREGGFQQGRS